MKERGTQTGVTTLTLLGVVFVILKVCGVIKWKWVWVLAPFWIEALILGVWLITVVWFLKR